MSFRLESTRNKYQAPPTIVDNIRFDSAKEAGRYSELKVLEVSAHKKNNFREVESRVLRIFDNLRTKQLKEKKPPPRHPKLSALVGFDSNSFLPASMYF